MSTWPTAELEAVATIDRTVILPFNIEASTPYVGLENIGRGGAITNVATVGESKISSAKFRFTEQQVLFGKLRPYLAKIARPNFSGVCSTDILPISPGVNLDKGYLCYFLSLPDTIALATSRASGANLPRLAPKELAKFQIPLPPIAEQRRIVQLLDSVDALRAKRQKAITILDSLAQSIFLEMFGANRLGCRRVDFPTAFWFQEGPGIRKWQFTENGVKLLNVGNIEKSGELNLSKTNRHISIEEAHGRYSHFLVDAGDLVIASSGISIDDDGMLRTRGSFVNGSLLPLCMNTSTIRFKSIPNVSDLYYLRSWLNSVEFRGQITRLVTGSAQLNFGPSHLKSLKISLPKFTTQKEFAKKIKRLDSEKLLLHTHLAELDALFASLQYRAFRGELWNDPLFKVSHSTLARPQEGHHRE